MTGLRIDVGVAAYLLDPSSGSVQPRVRRRQVSGRQPRLGTAPSGQLELDMETGSSDEDDRPRDGRRARSGVGLLAPVLTRGSPRTGWSGCTTRSSDRSSACSRGWRSPASRWTPTSCARIAADLRSPVQEPRGGRYTRLAGETFNVNSTPQLRAVLYDRLGLSPGRRTKTGFSTNAATLEKLRGTHPIIDTILSYREVEKLRSTYGESLLAEVGPDGRIHASFNQTVARTGRLSSDKPNLHNIPVRSEEGRRLRRAFVPAPGHLLLVSDYDQIELRVIAHLSGDPGTRPGIRRRPRHPQGDRGEGIRCAARGRHLRPDEAGRRWSLTGSPTGWSRTVSLSAWGSRPPRQQRSSALISRGSRSSATSWTVRSPKRDRAGLHGHASRQETTSSRSQLPEPGSAHGGGAPGDERRHPGPCGGPVQSGARASRRCARRGGFRSRLVLQVHDEVTPRGADGRATEETAVAELTRSVLAGVGDEVGLAVPLEVSIAWGSSWAEAKDHVSPGEDVAPALANG